VRVRDTPTSEGSRISESTGSSEPSVRARESGQKGGLVVTDDDGDR
jgi:hypothetical protein